MASEEARIMSLIELDNVIEGSFGILRNPGPPVSNAGAASAVQSLAVSGIPTGGTLSLSYRGSTATVPYNATSAQVQAALSGLPGIGAGNVTASGGPLPGAAVTITFAGRLANQPLPLVTASGTGLTGGTSPSASVTQTTAGVSASFSNAGTGQILEDTVNGVTYENKGAPGTPTWTQIGA